ncbi:MAG TPA: hypothetical protein VIK27_12150, partial [Candidatus Aquilonibacter sp.]
MIQTYRSGRIVAALACLCAFLLGYLPASAQPQTDSNAHVLDLINSQSCAVHEARLFAKERAQSFDEPEGSRY